MNRLKICYLTPIYTVDNEHKTVYCRLGCSIKNWNNIFKAFIKEGESFFYITTAAYCKGNDVFDPEKGKKIALAKAENKAEHKVISIIKRISNIMMDMNTVITRRYFDSMNNIDHNLEYINKY